MGGNNYKMDGQVQVDKTHVCGKEKNKHAKKKLNAGRVAVGKTAVVVMRDEKGVVRATPIKRADAATLARFLKNALGGGTVVTDKLRAYNNAQDSSPLPWRIRPRHGPHKRY